VRCSIDKKLQSHKSHAWEKVNKRARKDFPTSRLLCLNPIGRLWCQDPSNGKNWAPGGAYWGLKCVPNYYLRYISISHFFWFLRCSRSASLLPASCEILQPNIPILSCIKGLKGSDGKQVSLTINKFHQRPACEATIIFHLVKELFCRPI
jgi:hypothetical protein